MITKNVKELKKRIDKDWLKTWKRCARIYNLSIDDYLLCSFWNSQTEQYEISDCFLED